MIKGSNAKGETKMKNYLLEKEDFKNIFKEVVFFRNSKNTIVEIGYIEYNNLKYIKFYLIDGGICGLEGSIFMHTLKKIQNLLTELDIKEID